MAEVQIQTQQESMLGNSPRPIMLHKQKQQQQQQQPVIIPTSMLDLHQIHNQQANGTDHSVAVEQEPTDLFSMLHLSSSANRHRHPHCTVTAAANNHNNNNGKRRSPPSFSSGERSAKKLFCDQEDLTNHGFSAISLPLSLGNKGPVLRRSLSDRYNPPEHITPPPARGSGLPPLPPRFTRCMSDLTPSPAKASSRSLSSEETTPDSMRLRRMKDRLREMRQWWDEIMKEEEEGEEGGEEEEEEEEEEYCQVAENGKILSQDELGGDSEEAVSVEWAEKCVSLTFRCPCGKGYEVLISANNCYYKLL